jgi:hypothetical protein
VIKKIIGAAAIAAAVNMVGSWAAAEEVYIPHLSGVNGGDASGAVPPPGFYLVNTTAYAFGPSYNTNGDPTNVHINSFIELPALIWSSPYTIFGAHYAAAIAQPFDYTALTGIGGDNAGFSSGSAFATVLIPYILGWELPNNLHLQTFTDIYVPDGGYGNPLTHVAGNITALDQFAFEPGIGLSWLSDGWNVSAKAYLDINLRNQSIDYQSGNILGTEETVAKTFGKWTLGVGGFTQNQFSNDTGSAVALVNGPQAAIDGHRTTNYAVGPLVGYDFGTVNLEVWYDQTFGTVNDTGGGLLFTRVVVPLI